eukprot:1641930-Alexandrium_andersonii.AAC.1
MASWLGSPSGSNTPSKKELARNANAWDADMSEGDESTYTFKMPDTDNASSASTHASKASSTSEWVK